MERTLLWALLLFFASWGAVSIFALMSDDAGLFQSSGVLGIASALLLYGKQKEMANDLGEQLRAQELGLVQTEVELEILELSGSLIEQRVGGLSDKLSKAFEAESNMESLDEMELRAARSSARMVELRGTVTLQQQEVSLLKGRVKKVATDTTRAEIWVVSIATIQTGFGEKIASMMLGA